ncbi:peptidoglycan bridge formation glycyltransferase FemA/FemB family protein [Candidatus Collierbacteria bacterium]|nr:peptidoglycan bridge formation glycyltransferase FemA/FemB family protein [Candidatus Collierbacteria bacterium]
MTDITKSKWGKSLGNHPDGNFLQSWAWGEFHQKLGLPVYRVKFNNGMFQAIVEPAKRGRHLTVPGGPLLKNYFSVPQWKQAVTLMKEIAVKERCVFIRIRPQVSDTCKVSDTLQMMDFRPAPMHLHAQLTRVIDLTKTDEQLLSEMRKSTRYEIKKSLKMGIKVEKSQDEKLIDDFIKLQAETAKREGFVPFSKKYLLEQFREFNMTDSVELFFVSQLRPGPAAIARLGLSKPASIAFVIFYRGEAIYHYAASTDEARKIPAAYAIQWEIIQEAKKRGCKTYNLWGDVTDEKLLTHRFAGPSLFKRGFGGKQFAYLPAHDMPLNWKYWINWGIENLRKITRSL